MTGQAKDDLKEVFRSDMKTAEMMDNVVNNYDREVISEEAVDVAEEILGNIEDPKREKYVYGSLYQIGQSVGNEQLSNFAAEKLQAWVEQHG